jgi:hypothetical protein
MLGRPSRIESVLEGKDISELFVCRQNKTKEEETKTDFSIFSKKSCGEGGTYLVVNGLKVVEGDAGQADCMSVEVRAMYS